MKKIVSKFKAFFCLKWFQFVICNLIIISLCNNSYGHNYTDSLLASLQNKLADTARAALLSEISGAFVYQDADSGLRYGLMALAESKRIFWEPGIQSASINIGNNYRVLAKDDSARWHYNNALTIAHNSGDKLGLANCYNVIGMQYQSSSNYPEALRHLYSALALFEELKKKVGAAMCNGNIGIIYNNQNQYDKALEYYTKALDQYKEIDDKEGIAINLTNIGYLYKQMGEPQKALQIEQQALEMSRTLGAQNLVLINLTNIGLTYIATGQFAQALDVQRQALSESEKFGDVYYTAVNHGGIGGTYAEAVKDSLRQGLKQLAISKEGALRQAVAHLTIAIDNLAGGTAIAELAQYYGMRSQAFEMLGDSLSGARDYRKFVLFNDSVLSIENRIKISNLETSRKLQLADKQIELDNAETKKNRDDRVYLAAGICLLLVVVFFIARERKRSEHLLLNILPASIAARLKKDEHPIADAFANVSIIFIDMAGFTNFMREQNPRYTVSILNEIFTRFDVLAEKHRMEKIKTIGDCYMAVAGLPNPLPDHAQRTARMAIDVQQAMADYSTPDGTQISFRIGIDCGPVVAGVIGQRKFTYDLWGDAVNTAARMQSSGIPGEIHCTQNFKLAVGEGYRFTLNGSIDIKGIGQMETWLLKKDA